MKYIDGFRNLDAARTMASRIKELAALPSLASRTISVMEVCGSHTMAIARYGIRSLLPANLNLISGPGCPVCVTPCGYIDTAIALADHGAILATFGDMINVPGSDSSLARRRSSGASIEICYSPLRAVELAAENPSKEVVFLAVGFETTIGPVVSIVDAAIRRNLTNISLLTAFKLVPPALAALIVDPALSIDAFLCPAHVSAIIGTQAYEPCAARGKACVVAGFEPLDILLGIQKILEQLASGRTCVENEYSRVVRAEGNRKAQECIATWLEPCSAAWRGLGVIPDSGMKLRPAYSRFDALHKFGIPMAEGREPKACRCGDVIKGAIHPTDCPLFNRTCTPDHPVGPCMVSSEGTCSAWQKYQAPS